MASLASIATGNFTTAGTWGLCDATSENDSVAANTLLTTSYVESSTFTPGAITVDAIGVKVALRSGTTGTISVHLAIAGVEVTGSAVTINVSDINAGDTAANGGCGWYFFKFATPLTLLGATAYSVGAKTSSANQVNLFSSATTNWTRQLRTTTTQAPAAGDNLFIAGEWTAAATSSSFTVTNDNTATTAFGQIQINNKSTFAYGTSASTNYYLKSKTINVYDGGTYTVGTTGSPIPSTSTAVIEFNCTSAGEFGLEARNGSVISIQGYNRGNVRSLMTADKVATNTSIVVQDTTGWVATDEVTIPSTTQTSNQHEKRTIQSITNGTTFVITSGLTNNHSGTAPTQAEIMVLTRNIKFRSVSTTLTCYVKYWPTSSVDIDWLEITNMGTSTNTNYGFTVLTTTGSFSVRNSCFHDNTVSTGRTINIESTSGSNIEVRDNCFYGNTQQFGIRNVATSGIQVFDNNYIMGGNTPVQFNDAGSTVTNLKVASASSGIAWVSDDGATYGTIDSLTAHSNGGVGIQIPVINGGTVLNLTSWRNASTGINFSEGTAVAGKPNFIIADTGTVFGNATSNLDIVGRNIRGQSIIKNYTINGGSTLVSPVGLRLGTSTSTAIDSYSIIDCSFGATTAHSTADLQYPTTGGIANVQFYNTTFNSSTIFSQQAYMITIGPMWLGIGSTQHNGTNGNYLEWQGGGTLTKDTSIFNTASPSVRMTPINPVSIVIPLISPSKVIPIPSGETITVSVWVRKSAVGDGTAYTGYQPRLMVRANPSMGYDTDTALDTASAATGTWEELTGTTSSAPMDGALEFYVDCGCTGANPTTVAGWVNVDDFTTTSTTDPSDMKYGFNGSPTLSGSGNSGSSGGSFGFC